MPRQHFDRDLVTVGKIRNVLAELVGRRNLVAFDETSSGSRLVMYLVIEAMPMRVFSWFGIL